MLTHEQVRALCQRAAQGDAGAKDALVEANLRFVVKIARGFVRYGLPLEDLIQEGNLGLIEAVRHFDPDRGVKLVSYAVWWIRAFIQRYVLANWSLVKIGTTHTQRQLFFSLSRVRGELERLQGREPTAEELAGALGVAPDDVQDMTARLQGDVSLYGSVRQEDARELEELMPALDPSQEEKLAEREVRALVSETAAGALEHLDDREQLIVARRVLDDEPVTLRELGASLGVSRERVRQIQVEALKHLRQEMAPVLRRLRRFEDTPLHAA